MSDQAWTYPETLEIVPWQRGGLSSSVSVPGSKSITNRALILAALNSFREDCTLHGVLRSEDTEVMVDATQELGFKLDVDWDANRIVIHRHWD